MASVPMHFKNSWPYIQGHLLASRVPSTDPLPVQPPTGPLPVDPPSEVQTLLHVDMDMLENEPPPEPANVGRGWLGRLVSAGRHISVKAAETVGTAVGETVLTVRERIQQRQAEAEAAAALAAAAPAAAPAADGAEGPRFKGLFGRVAGEGDHASAAEIGERLNWGMRGLAQRSATVVGHVASQTRVIASDLRQKAAVTAHNTRARLASHETIEAQTVTFRSRFEKYEGAKALAELERSSVVQLERMRALQAEATADSLSLVDSSFMLLHSMLDLPMQLDGEAFSEPQESAELSTSLALSDASARAAAALESIQARYVRDVATLVSNHLSRTQALQQQAVSAAAEADSAEHEASGETGAAQQVRLAVYARRAVINSAVETIDRFSDASLHALAELGACAVKAMLDLEREFNTSLSAGVGNTPDAVLNSIVPARAAAVRLVAHSTLTGLKALRAAFQKAAVTVSDECANLCALPFEEEGSKAELAPVQAKVLEFSAGLDVDASSAAGITQDAVQFMLPIIKALTLAELHVADAKTPHAPEAESALASE